MPSFEMDFANDHFQYSRVKSVCGDRDLPFYLSKSLGVSEAELACHVQHDIVWSGDSISPPSSGSGFAFLNHISRLMPSGTPFCI